MAKKPRRGGPPARQAVDDLVASLAGDAAAEPGRFTLERGRARELLASRALSDPTRWVLLAVQAAVLRGATRLTATITPLTVDLAFDGEPLARDELDRLYDEAVSPALATTDLARSRRKLALALASIRALDWSEVTLDSGDGRQAARLQARPPDAESVQPAPAPVQGTRIHVVRTLGSGREPGERLALRERCRHAPLDLVANGEVIAPAPVFPSDSPPSPVDLTGVTGEAGFTPRHGQPCVLRLVQHGVLLEERPLPKELEHFVAVVHAPGQRTDLSGLEPVHDDAHRAIFEGVKALLADLQRRIDLRHLEARWLEAEVGPLLAGLERRRWRRRLRAYLVDTALYDALFQLVAVGAVLVQGDGRFSWLTFILYQPFVLLFAVIASDRRQLTFAPRPDDEAGQWLERRLRDRPDLRRAAAEKVQAGSSPLAFYLPDLPVPEEPPPARRRRRRRP